MANAADTLLDGRISDVLDTKGEYGRALVAASSVTDPNNPVGIILWADGCIHEDAVGLDALYCDELMGEPEKAGVWVWEGCLRVIDDLTTSYEGTWRPASPMEVALFQEGVSPFKEVARV